MWVCKAYHCATDRLRFGFIFVSVALHVAALNFAPPLLKFEISYQVKMYCYHFQWAKVAQDVFFHQYSFSGKRSTQSEGHFTSCLEIVLQRKNEEARSILGGLNYGRDLEIG